MNQKTDQTEDQNQSSEKERLLEAELFRLRTLLEQRQSETEESKLEKQAEALKAEEAALREQADLKGILKDAFHELPVTRNDDDFTSREKPQLNQKEMLDVMGEVISGAIDANTQLILNKVGEMVQGSDEKIVGTQKALIGLMSHISTNESRANHKDFDVFKEDIATIMSKTSGLSPEQAYLLAKAQKTEKVPGRREIETERPDAIVSRSSDYDDREYNSQNEHSDRNQDLLRNPRKEFKAGVSAAIDKVLANRSQ